MGPKFFFAIWQLFLGLLKCVYFGCIKNSSFLKSFILKIDPDPKLFVHSVEGQEKKFEVRAKFDLLLFVD